MRHFRRHFDSISPRGKASTAKKGKGKTMLRSEMLESRSMFSVTMEPLVQPLSGTSTSSGLTPAQVETAYSITGVTGSKGTAAGTGQTIAIIDAYNDPNIKSDLATFDAGTGLPAANLTVVNQSGGTNLPAANTSWSLEISLDVEWAHAIAPGANILLVEANSSNLNDLLSAVNYARNVSTVSVVSMSWGTSEFVGETQYDSDFTTPAGHIGISFVASSGDNGSPGLWPALSTNVLAVGGTSLATSSSGSYVSETAWSDSGGGTSLLESEPSYQTSVQSTGFRTSPDVSYDANPNTGYAVYDSLENGWSEVGGTSAGAPQWAGMIAIADQGAWLPANPPSTAAGGHLQLAIDRFPRHYLGQQRRLFSQDGIRRGHGKRHPGGQFNDCRSGGFHHVVLRFIGLFFGLNGQLVRLGFRLNRFRQLAGVGRLWRFFSARSFSGSFFGGFNFGFFFGFEADLSSDSGDNAPTISSSSVNLGQTSAQAAGVSQSLSAAFVQSTGAAQIVANVSPLAANGGVDAGALAVAVRPAISASAGLIGGDSGDSAGASADGDLALATAGLRGPSAIGLRGTSLSTNSTTPTAGHALAIGLDSMSLGNRSHLQAASLDRASAEMTTFDLRASGYRPSEFSGAMLEAIWSTDSFSTEADSPDDSPAGVTQTEPAGMAGEAASIAGVAAGILAPTWVQQKAEDVAAASVNNAEQGREFRSRVGRQIFRRLGNLRG